MHSAPPVDDAARAALYARALQMSQSYDAVPGSTTRLGNMGLFSRLYGNNFFINPNQEGWSLNGLSYPGGMDQDWNTEDEQFVVLGRDVGRRLRRMHKRAETTQLRRGSMKAAKWGGALWILGHELGHNRTPSLEEADADAYAEQHLKGLGRRLGLSQQQARRAFRAYMATR